MDIWSILRAREKNQKGHIVSDQYELDVASKNQERFNRTFERRKKQRNIARAQWWEKWWWLVLIIGAGTIPLLIAIFSYLS